MSEAAQFKSVHAVGLLQNLDEEEEDETERYPVMEETGPEIHRLAQDVRSASNFFLRNSTEILHTNAQLETQSRLLTNTVQSNNELQPILDPDHSRHNPGTPNLKMAPVSGKQ